MRRSLGDLLRFALCWWRFHNEQPRCALMCTCQVRGYLWYSDGQVWALSPEDVEVITNGR